MARSTAATLLHTGSPQRLRRLNLQTAQDLRVTEIEKAKEIERTIEPIRQSA
jgi:hypothetical protein